MLTWLKRWTDRREKARSLYGSIVTQARSRAFYADWGVPDTAVGRFEMVALHLVVVVNRLGRAGQPGRRLAQALTETFAVDLDDNLREMSVGDLAVPRHVKRAVGALHDRYAAYRAALAAPGDAQLAAAIAARLAPAGAGVRLDARQICTYIRQARDRLDRVRSDEVLAGRIAWPQIDAVEPDAGGGRRVTEGEHAG
jgi:cytochrome b pre-mRNA-processing protein 3